MSLKSFFSWFLPNQEVVALRSSRGWRKIRAAHLAENPRCVICGADSGLAVHHCLDVSSFPQHELEQKNLITVCTLNSGCNGHFLYCHMGDWRKTNYNIMNDIGVLRRIYRGENQGDPENLKKQRGIK